MNSFIEKVKKIIPQDIYTLQKNKIEKFDERLYNSYLRKKINVLDNEIIMNIIYAMNYYENQVKKSKDKKRTNKYSRENINDYRNKYYNEVLKNKKITCEKCNKEYSYIYFYKHKNICKKRNQTSSTSS